jgi:hypothetical protein
MVAIAIRIDGVGAFEANEGAGLLLVGYRDMRRLFGRNVRIRERLATGCGNQGCRQDYYSRHWFIFLVVECRVVNKDAAFADRLGGELAAVRRQGIGRVLVVQVVASVAVVKAIAAPKPAKVVHGMHLRRRTKMADVSHAADVIASGESTEAADVRAATESADMATAAEAAHVASTTEAAASMSAAAASAASIRRNREQAGGHQGRRQDRNHSFHVIAPFLPGRRRATTGETDMLIFERWEHRRVLPLNSLLDLQVSLGGRPRNTQRRQKDRAGILPARSVCLQKPVLGSHGGCVHGSEANAPTSGARTQLSGVTLS